MWLCSAEHLTWNIRDKHMAETAEHLAEHLKSRDIERPKIVICEPVSPDIRSCDAMTPTALQPHTQHSPDHVSRQVWLGCM